MRRPGSEALQPAGMPAPSSVIEEKALWRGPKRGAPSVSPEAAEAAYRILRTRELDPYDRPRSDAELPALGKAAPVVSDDYAGTARKAAKLSIAMGQIEQFDGIAGLVASLPSMRTMIDKNIPDDTESGRIDEEQRNVRVRAFLYAASRENDNDFHLIAGGAREVSSPVYLTMEISGLPQETASSFSQLQSARGAYKDFFRDDLPGPSYDFYDPPIPVEVEGSLFFDVSHAHGGHPGPASLRDHMPTIWEVHPVTKIVFEP